MARIYTHLDEAVSYLTTEINGGIGALKVAAPLGLGKANQLLNKLYEVFKKDPKRRQLEIYTALSLDIPATHTLVEKNLLVPFFDRHFGKNYPRLQYVADLKSKSIPEHINVYEFYFLAGQYIDVARAQQNYISLNYTHAARGISNRGLQVVIQIVSKRVVNGKASYSLSCNPDVTLDLVDIYKEQNKKIHLIAVVHPDLPYLGGDAIVDEDFFDVIVDSPEVQHTLFALPKNSIDKIDYMIGFNAAQLMPDDGTLQIGIGSLSDALVYSLLLRHQKNAAYKSLVERFWLHRPQPEGAIFYKEKFEEGIYGTSEMLMDGFMHLRKAGILKRMIFDQDEHKKRYLHGAFFLGSHDFYNWLRTLSEEDFKGLSMTRVSKVNDLYDEHEMALRRQRKNARFFNTCMQVNWLGGVVSETLEHGQVVSGVGGQYNFVSMSSELPDSHSVLMLRSVRIKNGRRSSNIVTSNGQLTIPRHLRDIVVTEYGVACLKGKTDSEVIAALIEISDSEFQSELIKVAIKNKKLNSDYVLPSWAAENTPVKLKAFVAQAKAADLFSENPFGSDFTEVENRIVKAISPAKEQSKLFLLKLLAEGILKNLQFKKVQPFKDELERLNLLHPKTIEERLSRLLVMGALSLHEKREKGG
jgi:acyl-CoA hydrolase